MKFDRQRTRAYTVVEMTIVVKNKTPLTIPEAVRRRAGLKPGDQVEFKAFRGGVAVFAKRLATQAAERLTQEEAKKLRHAMKEIREGKTTPWSQVKHELGL